MGKISWGLEVRKGLGSILLWMSTILPGLALEGRVVRPDGTPVADATVSILGLSGASRTDAQGRFTYRPDPPLPFEVVVVLADGSYTAPVLVKSLSGEGFLEIRVEPVISETVTVSASVTPNIEAPPASGMTAVERRELERRQPTRLTEVIENIPGVSKISDANTAVPSIRGLARGRTLILIDDARVTTERRAGPSASYLDPFFLEGVEVSRGPGSVAYGSDAFGGVIHARTRRPSFDHPWQMRFKGVLAAGVPERTAALEFSKGFRQGGFLLQGRYRSFDDYDGPNGRIDGSAASDRGLLARTAFEKAGGLFSVGWQSDFGRSIGRADTRLPEVRIFQPEETSHRFTVEFDADPKWGFTRLGLDGFVGTYRLVTARDELPGESSLRNIQESDVKAKDYSFRALAARPMRQGRVEFGLDFNGRFGLQAVDRLRAFDAQDRPVDIQEELSVADARRDNLGLYLSADQALGDRLTASGGLRYDRVKTRNNGGLSGDFQTSNDSFSGYASLAATLSPGLTLTGQVARGFRDPTLSDRYFSGLSGRGFVTGNPLLEPENSLQFDVSLRGVSSGLRWGVFFYHYRIDDLIERFEAQDDQFFFRNRGRARLRGLEVELQARLPSHLSLEMGAQVSSGRALDDDEALDDVPVRNINLVLRRAFWERGYFQLRGALFASDDDPGPTEISTPGYGLLDAGAGWKLRDGYELRFMLRNLLDKDYPVSPDSRAVEAPGITGIVTLAVEL